MHDWLHQERAFLRVLPFIVISPLHLQQLAPHLLAHPSILDLLVMEWVCRCCSCNYVNCVNYVNYVNCVSNGRKQHATLINTSSALINTSSPLLVHTQAQAYTHCQLSLPLSLPS
jgi:hypothetical protein